MNQDQSFTWELLLILGLIVVFISFWGKILGGIVQEILTRHELELNWDPLSPGGGWNPITGNTPPEQLPGGSQFIRRDPQGRIHIGPDWAPEWMR